MVGILPIALERQTLPYEPVFRYRRNGIAWQWSIDITGRRRGWRGHGNRAVSVRNPGSLDAHRCGARVTRGREGSPEAPEAAVYRGWCIGGGSVGATNDTDEYFFGKIGVPP